MRRAVLLVLAGAAVAAAVQGCTAAGPAPPPAPTPTPAGFSWPAVRGRVLDREVTATERTERIAVADPEAAYRRARDLLVAGGFLLTKDRPGRGGGDGQACTTALCVNFSATGDPESGASLRYEAFHSTGVGPRG